MLDRPIRPPRNAMSLSISDSGPVPRTNVLASFAEDVILSWGWRRRAIAFLVGRDRRPRLAAVFAFRADGGAADRRGMADRWFVRSRETADRASERFGPLSAPAGGWAFGYFLAGLWWLGAAFLVEADKFAWALPLGVLALPAGLALFPAFGFALARLLWSAGPTRIFALAFGLGLANGRAASLFTGFPWNDIGMALGANLTTGADRLDRRPAWADVPNDRDFRRARDVVAVRREPLASSRRPSSRRSPFRSSRASANSGCRRRRAPPSTDVKLRLMQPNVSQGASFAPENKEKILQRYLALSDRATARDRGGVGSVTHLIWPESAFPFILSRDAQALAEITDFLRGGATLITGAARVEDFGGRQPRYFNSIEVVDRTGPAPTSATTSSTSCPSANICRSRAFFRARASPNSCRFRAASRPARAGASSVFPACPTRCPSSATRRSFRSRSATRSRRRTRPEWMLNVTDDAWFGLTPGPYQHYRAGAAARDRTRTAAGARRQFRHFGGHRRPRPRNRVVADLARKTCSTPSFPRPSRRHGKPDLVRSERH